MDFTKTVNEIVIDEKIYFENKIREKCINNIKILEKKLLGIIYELEEFSKKNEWITLDNGEYINMKKSVIISSIKRKCYLDTLHFDSFLDSKGFFKNNKDNLWIVPNEEEVKSIIMDKASPYYRKYKALMYKNNKKKYYCMDKNGEKYDIENILGKPRCFSSSIRDEPIYVFYCIPIKKVNNKSFVDFIINTGNIPIAISDELKNNVKFIINKIKKKEILFDKGVKLNPQLKENILDGKINSYLDIPFNNGKLIEEIKANENLESQQKISINQNKTGYLKSYLECDKKRADMDSYELVIMEEPQRGHWELWDSSSTYGKNVKIDIPLVARNPLADINENGIVGIDFGTKSTIVAYQNGHDVTQLMRIGKGKISKEVRENDFENPTVMQFRNINKFRKNYQGAKGRPFTEWNDLTISYTAEQSLMEANVNRSEFHSFFYNLKQWAGDRTGNVKLKDINGVEINLPAFLQLKENDIDPIELYAYYIGLYINNMRNGIYLKYLLSFPVSYDRASKERILLSFKRGIMKSLPKEILDDKSSMNEFSVKQGAAEPAAYAICALEQYGLEPKGDNDCIFYGVFDFGGGTTDYDFGLWKYADESDELYDYVINHFGSGTDKYLGGENLLERLAYEVFIDNITYCRENEIVFQKPSWLMMIEEYKYYINESQEARINTKQVMEKLRPFWERQTITVSNRQNDKSTEKNKKVFEDGYTKLTLYDRNGNVKTGQNLQIDEDKLRKILFDEIEKGVVNFFEALNNAFINYDIEQVECINIFLAGNSSKSPLVQEIFDKHIKEESFKIEKVYKKLGKTVNNDALFVLYPPLGTQNAKEIQKSRGIEIDNTKRMPTGKTGVAYGLLEVRPGNGIKVIEEVAEGKESKFRYYLGTKKRKKFVPKITPETEYGKWTRFLLAAQDTFELYYSILPEAATGNLETSDSSVMYKRCSNPKINQEDNIYIRLLDPVTIEYAIGKDEEHIDGKTINKIILFDK